MDAALGWINQDVIAVVEDDVEHEFVPERKRVKPAVAKVRNEKDFDF